MHRVTFVARTRIPASAEAVFDWHEAPGAFERLTPPWERVRVLAREGGIRDGARVSLLVGPWPLSLRWELEHRDYQHGRSFTDLQQSVPFAPGSTRTGWFQRVPTRVCWRIRSSTSYRSARSAGCSAGRSCNES